MIIPKSVYERDLAGKHWTRYTNALSRGHIEFQKQAKLCEDFYLGGGRHWSSDVKASLEAIGKPWLEENIIFSTVNAVLGVQSQSRMDLAYKPRENDDQGISDALTKIGMFVLDQNKFPWLESQVFADGVIQQRGYYDIRMDFDKNIFGDIKITCLDPLDVVPDPDAKSYDPDDWEDVIVAYWLPLDALRTQYGRKKAIQVEGSFDQNLNLASTSSAVNGEEPRNSFANNVNYNSYFSDSTETYYAKVLDRQYWKLTNRKFFIDELGDLQPVPDGMKDREAKRFAKENGLELITKLVRRIRWTISTQDVVLHDDWSPYDHFTVVPYFPYFRRGVTVGLVDNLIKTQEMINKVFSQVLHTVNSTANSGWEVEEGSLTNMDTEDLEDVGAQTGLVLEYKRGSSKPEKIEPNQIPTGLTNLITTGVELVRLISGVSETFQGAKSNEISGVAIQSKVQQTAVQLAVPIDNLFRTRNMMGSRILKLIQQFMTDPRILTITTPEQNSPNEQLPINQEDPVTGEIINDVTVGKYDVVIADVPTQITFQNAQFAQAVEMRKFGVNIPDEEIVMMSTLSRKQQIVEKITGGEPSEEETKQLELQIEQLENVVKKLEADAASKQADSVSKLANVALLLKQNPGLAPLLDTLIEKQDKEEEVETEQPEQPLEVEPDQEELLNNQTV